MHLLTAEHVPLARPRADWQAGHMLRKAGSVYLQATGDAVDRGLKVADQAARSQPRNGASFASRA